ncbi:MAG: YggS family pyridoxal phosphate-dependent enzyme [Ferruginibacter sp.]
MLINTTNYHSILQELSNKATLVAVSKTKPNDAIAELYALGQKDFGENYVQELVDKAALLPQDIRWHFIGHLQSNKVKYIAPFVYLIHGVDSFSLLKEINKQAQKQNRVIDCLLQMHIAQEETKFGLNAAELYEIIEAINVQPLPHVCIKGLMGMASFTSDTAIIENEFKQLYIQFEALKKIQCPGIDCTILSMGMSSDYTIAVAQGSNMVRIGSLLFGERNYNK